MRIFRSFSCREKCDSSEQSESEEGALRLPLPFFQIPEGDLKEKGTAKGNEATGGGRRSPPSVAVFPNSRRGFKGKRDSEGNEATGGGRRSPPSVAVFPNSRRGFKGKRDSEGNEATGGGRRSPPSVAVFPNSRRGFKGKKGQRRERSDRRRKALSAFRCRFSKFPEGDLKEKGTAKGNEATGGGRRSPPSVALRQNY